MGLMGTQAAAVAALGGRGRPEEVSSWFVERIGWTLDDSSQLTQVWINVDHPGSVAHGPGLGESSESYEEKGADECVKELSMSASQEEGKDKEDKK